MSLQVLLRASTYSGSGAWLDESGFSRNATLETGTIAKNVAGNGIVLNGSTGWTFPSPTGGLGNAWTVSVWYKNTGAQVGVRACVVTQRVGTYINAFIGYGLDAFNFSGGFYNGVGGWQIGTPITLTNNVWTNIQVTWDGTSMKTYINATLLGTTTPGGIARNATGNLAYRIGRRWDSADYMVGEIGEVRLYNTTLNQTQVTADYNASYSTFNLTAPTAPLIYLRPIVSSQTLQFNWQAPTSDGGSAITQYNLASGQDGLSPYTISSTLRTYIVSTLSNSTQYTYTITATNAIGAGTAATFRTVQPGLGAPIVPNTTATTTGATTATVAWTAADLSGIISPLLGYSVMTKPVGASPPYTNRGRPVGATSIDVSGLDLTNNAYVFRVSAVNDPNYSVGLETNPIGKIQYNFTNTSLSNTLPWIGAAISADATIMIAGEAVPWISNNGGTTWQQLNLFSAGTVNTFSAFISTNGTFIAIAVNGTSQQNIWTSSNSGTTWTERTASGARAWTAITGSSSGDRLAAVAVNANIYTSNDYGATWTARYTTGVWFGVASDSTGQYLAAIRYGGYIFTSSNYGVNWTQRASVKNWYNIASDSTGRYLVAVATGNYIWTSSNYGVTWVQRTSAGVRNWYSVSCSSTGSNIIVGVTGSASLWASSDFGVTWIEQTGSSGGGWFGVAASANARTILAVKSSGGSPVIGIIE